MADENRVQLGRVVPNYLGDWSSTKSYSKLDSVVYNNVGYIANKDVAVGVVPGTDSASWRVTNRGAIGPKGDKGDKGDQGIQGPTGPQGERGKQIFKSSAKYYEPNSLGHWWSDLSPAVSSDNPPKVGDTIINSSGNIFQINTVNAGDGGGGGGTFGVGVVLGNITGPQGPKGDMDLSQITVGGRNIMIGTSDWSGGSSRWDYRSISMNGTYRGAVIATTSSPWKSPMYLVQNAGILQVGKTYTFSTYVRNTSDTDTKVSFYYDINIVTQHGYTVSLPAHTDWTRVFVTFKVLKDPTTSTQGLRWEGQNTLTNGQIQFAGYKLEEGNVGTDWTPAPEDANSTYLKKSNQLPAEARDFNYLATHMQTYQGTWWTGTEEILNGPTSGWTWATIEVIPGNSETTGQIMTMRYGLSDIYSANVNGGNLGAWLPLTPSSRVATFSDLAVVAKSMRNYAGSWMATGSQNIQNGPTTMNFNSIITVVNSWDDAGLIIVSSQGYNTWVGGVSSGTIQHWTLIADDANAVHKTGTETISGDKSFTGNTTLANVKTSSIKTGTVTANGLRMDFREFATGVEVWFTGTFTGDASYSWHDLGQMPSNITKPFSYVTAVMGGRSGIGGVSTQTDQLLMVHINSTGKIQYQLRHGVENNTTDYKGIVLYVEGSTSYFK